MANIEKFLSDGGPLTNRISKFYEYKTIQRSYNFLIYFDESGSGGFDGTFGDLLAYHASSIDIPDYGFKKEYVNYGNFSKAFPILEHNGFEFTIKMEEDELGTVKELIHKLVHKNINDEGYYQSYKNTTIKNIVASVYTQDSWNVYKIFFKNCFYLKASTAQYSFSNNDKIEYDVTFNCDHYEILPHLAIPEKDFTENANTTVLDEQIIYGNNRAKHKH